MTLWLFSIPDAHLKDSLGSIALDIVAVYDDLDDTIPHLLADMVAGDADEVEDCIHVPGVVHSVLLRQDSHLEYLGEREKRVAEGESGRTKETQQGMGL